MIIETFGWSNHVSIDLRLSHDASSLVIAVAATDFLKTSTIDGLRIDCDTDIEENVIIYTITSSSINNHKLYFFHVLLLQIMK